MSVAALLLTFKFSDVAIESMSVGMKLCVSTVIPSLFPFMVLSELFVSSGAAELLGRFVGKPFEKLFGISKEASAAILLGFFCGFPIGTKSALSLYEKGRISRSELEHICVFCNNPSSAFLISAVGLSLFGSREFGILLYVAHLLSSCIIGFVGRFYFGKKKREYVESGAFAAKKRSGFISTLSGAVTSSASSMLFICAFVIFFSAVLGYVQFFAEKAELPSVLNVLCLGFFEMTGGVAASASLPLPIALPVAASLTGWSGLSVHFQFVGICREHRLDLRPYFLAKICAAGLNFLIISVLLKLFSGQISFDVPQTVPSLISAEFHPLALVSLSLFFASSLALAAKARS